MIRKLIHFCNVGQKGRPQALAGKYSEKKQGKKKTGGKEIACTRTHQGTRKIITGQ